MDRVKTALSKFKAASRERLQLMTSKLKRSQSDPPKKGKVEKPRGKPKDTQHKWRRRLKYGLYYTFLLLFLMFLLVGFSFLRHRQLCNYQGLVDQGLVTAKDQSLCPNLLDTNDWGQILANAFNIGILDHLSVNVNGEADQQEVEACTDQLNPLCWIKGSKPELKQENGYTNLLLVGVDTREGSNLKNTDSIMLASMEQSSGSILLISFPRDLQVYYYRPNGWYVNSKINAVYAYDGIEGLTGVVSQITGRPVHYHALIKLQTFTNLIDVLGGIDITLPEDFADVYPCSELPDGYNCPEKRYIGDGYYGLFRFPAGLNHFDSTQALVYARSRKYSSDYERARRQQDIFKAVLSNAIHKDMPITERVSTYLELYNSFVNDVETNIELADVAGVLSIFELLNEDNVARIVADPNLDGGRLIYVKRNPSNQYAAYFRDIGYGQFQSYIENTWKYLPFYIENPKVLVVNKSGYAATEETDLFKLLNNGNSYWTVGQVDSEERDTGIKLYDLSEGSKLGSLRKIQEDLPGSLVYSTQIDGIEQTEFGEDLQIIWGRQEGVHPDPQPEATSSEVETETAE